MGSTRYPRMGVSLIAVRADFEDCEECFLGNLDTANAFHAAFAFLLLLEKFALARNVAAIAFRKDVLAHGRDGFAGDHFVPDRGLQSDFEHLAGN